MCEEGTGCVGRGSEVMTGWEQGLLNVCWREETTHHPPTWHTGTGEQVSTGAGAGEV